MNKETQETSVIKKPFNSNNEDFNAFLNNTKPSENFQNFQQNQVAQSDYESTNENYDYFSKDNNNRSYYSSYQNYPQYSSQYWQYPYQYQPNTFYNKFPRAKDYNDENSIFEALPHLKGINDPNFNIDSIESDDHFYIMRSSNDDNVHKGIKYHIWTSTVASNNKLKEAWADANAEGKQKPNKIYLVFSVVNSFQFMGVAEMSLSPEAESFNYWWEPNKWFGSFQLKWVFIKDVQHSKFEHIKEENQTITSCKDCTRLSAKSGKQILNIFRSSPNKPNIFEAFEFMDKREDILRFDRDRDPSYNEQFKKKSEYYKTNPEQFQSRKPFYNKYKRNNNGNYYNKFARPYYNYNRNYNGQNNYNGYNNYHNDSSYGYNNGNTNNYGYNNTYNGSVNGYSNYGNNYYNNSNSHAETYNNNFGYNNNSNSNNNNNNSHSRSNSNSNNSPVHDANDEENVNNGQQRNNSNYHGGNNYYNGNARTQQPKELEDQFLIKKTGPKVTEKSEKRNKKGGKGKKSNDDKVPNEFFDNKTFTPNHFNVQDDDDDSDDKKLQEQYQPNRPIESEQ